MSDKPTPNDLVLVKLRIGACTKNEWSSPEDHARTTVRSVW